MNCSWKLYYFGLWLPQVSVELDCDIESDKFSVMSYHTTSPPTTSLTYNEDTSVVHVTMVSWRLLTASQLDKLQGLKKNE